MREEAPHECPFGRGQNSFIIRVQKDGERIQRADKPTSEDGRPWKDGKWVERAHFGCHKGQSKDPFETSVLLQRRFSNSFAHKLDGRCRALPEAVRTS